MGGYEVGFLRWCGGNQGLEVCGQRIEFWPRWKAGSVGCAELGEIGPVVLHGAGKLQLRGSERRARNGDRQIKQILDLRSVRRAVGERDRRQKILRRVFVVEFVSLQRDEWGH